MLHLNNPQPYGCGFVEGCQAPFAEKTRGPAAAKAMAWQAEVSRLRPAIAGLRRANEVRSALRDVTTGLRRQLHLREMQALADLRIERVDQRRAPIQGGGGFPISLFFAPRRLSELKES
jgi:hypothetical protein